MMQEKLVLKERIGQRLKERRLQLNMTQREVAEHLSVAQPVYQRFEKGTYECNYEQLQKLCRLFDISADYLLELEKY